MLEPTNLKKMSVAERLQAMEQIWDSLSQQEAELSSPSWHEEVLSDRKQRAERGTTKFLTLDQLRDRLRDSSK